MTAINAIRTISRWTALLISYQHWLGNEKDRRAGV